MRLWHYKLISFLPRQQLLGQHRECCALRGNGWRRKHATVDYIFRYNPARLFFYHTLVLQEMTRRGYKYSEQWNNIRYRGSRCEPWPQDEPLDDTARGYDEHDAAYLVECVDNLRRKGAVLNFPGRDLPASRQ